MKKRQALGLENVPIPALPGDSKLLEKLPLLREFLSVTAYDDGSMRQPGSYRFENKLICYQITLYDADAGMRLPVSGATIDDVMKAAERLLGAPDAPWEVDRYLTEQLQKKSKEKGGVKKNKK